MRFLLQVYSGADTLGVKWSVVHRSSLSTERHTTDELRELVKLVRSGTFHYDGRPKRSLDWASNNEAQPHETFDTLALIRRFVNLASAYISLDRRTVPLFLASLKL